MKATRMAEIEGLLSHATNGGRNWYEIDQVIRGYWVHGISYKNDDGDGDWVMSELGPVDSEDLRLICQAGPVICELLEAVKAMKRSSCGSEQKQVC